MTDRLIRITTALAVVAVAVVAAVISYQARIAGWVALGSNRSTSLLGCWRQLHRSSCPLRQP